MSIFKYAYAYLSHKEIQNGDLWLGNEDDGVAFLVIALQQNNNCLEWLRAQMDISSIKANVQSNRTLLNVSCY